jgi:hypothetical protein
MWRQIYSCGPHFCCTWWANGRSSRVRHVFLFSLQHLISVTILYSFPPCTNTMSLLATHVHACLHKAKICMTVKQNLLCAKSVSWNSSSYECKPILCLPYSWTLNHVAWQCPLHSWVFGLFGVMGLWRYGAWAPSIEECPKEMASTMLHLRDTAAGKVSSWKSDMVTGFNVGPHNIFFGLQLFQAAML